MKQSLSIYVHYPFCKSKCPYCDFNSHVRDGIDHARFLRAYEKELEFFAAKIPDRKIATIFFGGGTPSLMPTFLLAGILQKISQLWQIDENCEISLEANPTSFEATKFKDFQRLGVNRLSLGIQALNDKDLKFLGREHSADEAISTIETAAEIFENFSFDLIYARPEQSLESWRDELSRAINFCAKHLSLYQLTIEKGTKFFADFTAKKFAIPDENLAAEFYEMTSEITSDAGLQSYEISNYAQRNHECRHNLVYWQGGEYLGVGAGAHSRVNFLPSLLPDLLPDGVSDPVRNVHAAIEMDVVFEPKYKTFRSGSETPTGASDDVRHALTMLHDPASWLKKVEESGAGIQKQEKISPHELAEELILMGLRLSDGIEKKTFCELLKKNFSEIFDEKKLAKLEQQGLVEVSTTHLKIPHEKKLLTNAIISKVIDTIAYHNIHNTTTYQ